MIKVRLIQKVGTPIIIGTIEFHGVHVEQVDGTLKMPIGREGGMIPYRAVLNPPNIVSNNVVEEIKAHVERREVVGKISEYEWQVEN